MQVQPDAGRVASLVLAANPRMPNARGRGNQPQSEFALPVVLSIFGLTLLIVGVGQATEQSRLLRHGQLATGRIVSCRQLPKGNTVEIQFGNWQFRKEKEVQPGPWIPLADYLLQSKPILKNVSCQFEYKDDANDETRHLIIQLELQANGMDGHRKDLLYIPPGETRARLLEQFGYGLNIAGSENSWSIRESALIVRVTLILVSLAIIVHGFVG